MKNAPRRSAFGGLAVALLSAIAIACVALSLIDARATARASALAAAGYAPSPAYTPAPEPRVAFMGDSYTAGSGASSDSSNFVALVSAYEAWNAANEGRGGTGYYATNTYAGCGLKFCPNYARMISTVVKVKPTVVVVSGGRNDAAYPIAAVSAAIAHFYPMLRKALPKAKIYVTSPIWDASTAPVELGAIATDIRAAAKQVGATYLDIGQPLRGHTAWIVSDHIHPDDRGHAAIAAAIEGALKRNGVTPSKLVR